MAEGKEEAEQVDQCEVTWADVETAFRNNGSLRDIYVPDTTIDDWQRILDAIKSGPYLFRYARNYSDVQPADDPGKAADIFAIYDDKDADAPPTLWLDIDGLTIACHFFYEGEIEFDLDPREVHDAADWQTICRFLRTLFAWMQKPVLLTYENMQDWVIVRLDPPGGIPIVVRGPFSSASDTQGKT